MSKKIVFLRTRDKDPPFSPSRKCIPDTLNAHMRLDASRFCRRIGRACKKTPRSSAKKGLKGASRGSQRVLWYCDNHAPHESKHTPEILIFSRFAVSQDDKKKTREKSISVSKPMEYTFSSLFIHHILTVLIRHTCHSSLVFLSASRIFHFLFSCERRIVMIIWKRNLPFYLVKFYFVSN